MPVRPPSSSRPASRFARRRRAPIIASLAALGAAAVRRDVVQRHGLRPPVAGRRRAEDPRVLDAQRPEPGAHRDDRRPGLPAAREPARPTGSSATTATSPTAARSSRRRSRRRRRRRRPSPTRTRTWSSATSTAPTRRTTTARTSCTRATSSARAATSRGSTSTPTRRTGSRCSPPTQVATDNLPAGHLPVIDGSVWNPFTRTLLFSNEGNGTSTGGIWEATPDAPSTVVDRLGLFGRGGYEGIQEDNDGNIWLVEDIGGKNGTAGAGLPTNLAKQPNSFVFRFVPYAKRDLDAGGRLQVLQVEGKDGKAVDVHGRRRPDPGADRTATSPRPSCATCTPTATRSPRRWVTIHDTRRRRDQDVQRQFARQGQGRHAVQAARERPVPAGVGLHRVRVHRDRRHERARRAPTARRAPRTAAGAGCSASRRSTRPRTPAGCGRCFLGDLEHTGLDNITFLDRNHVIAVEDAGATASTPSAARLDSGYVVTLGATARTPPRIFRFLASGPRRLGDARCQRTPGFGKNEDDNEITGIHLSDGDPSGGRPHRDATTRCSCSRGSAAPASGGCSGPSSTGTT